MIKFLMLSSAAIAIILGIVHLAYTFSGTHLLPRDPALQIAMSQSHLSITKETTVFRAWIGFNVSHSIALMLFGLVFGYLVCFHSQLLFDSYFLLAIGFITLVGFLVLAKVYWFSIPFLGILLALIFYCLSILIRFFKGAM